MTDKKEQTLRLLRATGMLKTFSIMFDNYRSLGNESETDFYNKLEKFMIEDGIVDRMAEAYEELFTNEEISKAAEYYESDVGQKFVTMMPALNEKIQPITIQMVARFISEVLEKEGVEQVEQVE